MHRYILCARHVLLAALCNGPGVIAASEPARDVAAEVRIVFDAKCASCHGADLAKPEGRFGYVLDLARVAANPEIIVPSSPNESEMWELVRREEMPPDDSPTGPLSQQDKDAIHAWIAAGAPPGLRSSSEKDASQTVSTTFVPVVDASLSQSPRRGRQAPGKQALRERHRGGRVGHCRHHVFQTQVARRRT
jgi:mono/diheme cytochrome c family protein